MTDSTKPADPAQEGRFWLVQAVTLARLPLAAGFATLLLCMERTTGVLIGALVLLLLCELTDFLDGLLARRIGVHSEWGAMLDPYSDSISRMIIYWGLACSGLAMAIVPLAMAIRDITVAYSRIFLARYGHSVAANWSGKIKAGVQAVGAWLLVLGPIYWKWTGEWPRTAISLIVLVTTLASAVQYIKSAYSAAKNTSAEGRL